MKKREAKFYTEILKQKYKEIVKGDQKVFT